MLLVSKTVDFGVAGIEAFSVARRLGLGVYKWIGKWLERSNVALVYRLQAGQVKDCEEELDLKIWGSEG
jgi:hypothetical protein